MYLSGPPVESEEVRTLQRIKQLVGRYVPFELIVTFIMAGVILLIAKLVSDALLWAALPGVLVALFAFWLTTAADRNRRQARQDSVLRTMIRELLKSREKIAAVRDDREGLYNFCARVEAQVPTVAFRSFLSELANVDKRLADQIYDAYHECEKLRHDAAIHVRRFQSYTKAQGDRRFDFQMEIIQGQCDLTTKALDMALSSPLGMAIGREAKTDDAQCC